MMRNVIRCAHTALAACVLIAAGVFSAALPQPALAEAPRQDDKTYQPEATWGAARSPCRRVKSTA